MFDYDLIILGGGWVGLSAALGFSHQGRRVALIDPKPLPCTQDRVYALRPQWSDFFKMFDAWPSCALPVKGMRIFGDSDLGQLSFDGDPLAYMVEHQPMSSLLVEKVRHAGVTIIQDHVDAIITDDLHECIMISINGMHLKAALCIGADGASSWSRSYMNQDILTKSYAQSGIVARFRCDQDHQNIARQWFIGESILAYLPIRPYEISIVWSHPIPKNISCRGIEQAVAQAGDYSLGKLTLLGDVQFFPLAMRHMHIPYKGRMLWLGDAAHTIHPLAGQGVNLGLDDVRVFLKLSQYESDLGHDKLLARFSQERYIPMKSMQLGCDVLYHLFRESFPGVKIIRNLGMSLVDHLPWLKSKLIHYAQR
jgi:2-octaprenylphenol hydroxylase